MTEVLNNVVSAKGETRDIIAAKAKKNTLTDEQLFHLCKKYGENARYWRRKFAGLLPEVLKRRLYEKEKFGSIFEFGAKLAGMSHEQVQLVLNLERKFEDKPTLRSLLINGEVSANKLVRIASIATAENQESLAERVRVLSKNALETFVRDVKNAAVIGSQNWDQNDSEDFVWDFKNGVAGDGNNIAASAKNDGASNPQNEHPDGLQKLLFDDKSLPGHSNSQYEEADVKLLETGMLEAAEVSSEAREAPRPASKPILHYIKILEALSEETKNELLELVGKGINIEQLVSGVLENRKTEIARAKEEIVMEQEIVRKKKEETVKAEVATKNVAADRKEVRSASSVKIATHSSRYVPARIRKIINAEQGDKCSMPGCCKPAEVMHHELPFSITKTHDPNNLKKLCRAHHELRHSINVRFYEIKRRVLNSG